MSIFIIIIIIIFSMVEKVNQYCWFFANISKLRMKNNDYNKYISTKANTSWLKTFVSLSCTKRSLRCITIETTNKYAQYEYEYKGMNKTRVVSIILQHFYNLKSIKISVCTKSVIVRVCFNVNVSIIYIYLLQVFWLLWFFILFFISITTIF